MGAPPPAGRGYRVRVPITLNSKAVGALADTFWGRVFEVINSEPATMKGELWVEHGQRVGYIVQFVGKGDGSGINAQFMKAYKIARGTLETEFAASNAAEVDEFAIEYTKDDGGHWDTIIRLLADDRVGRRANPKAKPRERKKRPTPAGKSGKKSGRKSGRKKR